MLVQWSASSGQGLSELDKDKDFRLRHGNAVLVPDSSSCQTCQSKFVELKLKARGPNSPTIIDIDKALDSSCGDPNFLVIILLFLFSNIIILIPFLQVQLVNAVCISIKECICQISSFNHLPEMSHDKLIGLLLKLQNSASVVGFLSLASHAACCSNAVKSLLETRKDPDPSAIADSLAAELEQAEAEWRVSKIPCFRAVASPQAAWLDGPFPAVGPEPSTPILRATVIRRGQPAYCPAEAGD